MFVPFGRITGGTLTGWRRRINRDGYVKCVTPDCTYVTTEITEIHAHHNQCVLGGGGGARFICGVCKFGPSDKQTLEKHCLELHKYMPTKDKDFTDSGGSDADPVDDEDDSSEDGGASGCEEVSMSTLTNGSFGDDSSTGGKKSTKSNRNRSANVSVSINSDLTFDRKVLQNHVDQLKMYHGVSCSMLTTQWTIEL